MKELGCWLRSQESEKVNIIILQVTTDLVAELLGQGGGGCKLNSAKQLKKVLQASIYLWNRCGSLYNRYYFCLSLLLLLDNSQGVPAGVVVIVPLRSLITETCLVISNCGRAQITKWLRPKIASLMSRNPCLVLFLWGPPTLSAYTYKMSVQKNPWVSRLAIW